MYIDARYLAELLLHVAIKSIIVTNFSAQRSLKVLQTNFESPRKQRKQSHDDWYLKGECFFAGATSSRKLS